MSNTTRPKPYLCSFPHAKNQDAECICKSKKWKYPEDNYTHCLAQTAYCLEPDPRHTEIIARCSSNLNTSEVWLLLVQANVGASFCPHWCLYIVATSTAINWSYLDEMALSFFYARQRGRRVESRTPFTTVEWDFFFLLICLRQARYNKYDRTDVMGH